MNRSDRIRFIFAELRLLHPEVPSGALLRLSAAICTAFELEDVVDEDPSPRSSRAYYSQPVDFVLRDSGWSNLILDRRTNFCIWDESPDAADLTAGKLKRLVGTVQWPRITRMD